LLFSLFIQKPQHQKKAAVDARESIHLKKSHIEDSRLLEQALESRLEARLSELKRDHIPLGQHEQTLKAAIASAHGT
jgi:hypothetical protein